MLLTIMNRKWENLGIENSFSKVSHLKHEQISENSLSSFVEYCSHRRIKGQNAQTIDRALEAAHYVEKGITPSIAIELAWKSYPLLKM